MTETSKTRFILRKTIQKGDKEYLYEKEFIVKEDRVTFVSSVLTGAIGENPKPESSRLEYTNDHDLKTARRIWEDHIKLGYSRV